MKRACLAFLLLVACKDPPASVNLEKQFWDWFATHAEEVGKLKRADEPIANQLEAELRKVNPKLTFELGIGAMPKELIISADGIRAVFPAVQKLVAVAPAIPGWKVIAFRPRKSITQMKIGENRIVRVADLRVAAHSRADAKIDVDVYAPAPVDDATKSAVFLLLDSVLGEYDVETRLGAIEFREAKTAPADARPFEDLRVLIDKR